MPNDSSSPLINTEALSLRSSIEASTAQLDQRGTVQVKQCESCKAANEKARFHAFADRLAIAKHRAKKSFPLLPSDPLCDPCESPFHSTGTCDFSEALKALEREDRLNATSVAQVSENPSTGIQRATVHRLCLNVFDLCLLNHPRFCQTRSPLGFRAALHQLRPPSRARTQNRRPQGPSIDPWFRPR